jgi:outer membrane protein assembly factor BamB
MSRIQFLLNMAMRRLPQALAGVLLMLSLSVEAPAQQTRTPGQTPPQPRKKTQLPPGSGLLRIAARWSPQPGVSRYRFQLARDSKFNDIVLDRIVTGTEYEVADVKRRKYFWRVAPLSGDELGQFSEPRPVEPFRKMQLTVIEPPPTDSVVMPTVAPPPHKGTPTTRGFVSEGGWRAAIGSVARPMLVHLRSAGTADLVAMNSDGVVFAVDAESGVTLWAARTSAGLRKATFSPVAVPAAGALDNVLVAFDGGVRLLQGATARELWRVSMTSGATVGVALALGNRSAAVFVVSNGSQRLVMLDGDNGELLAEAKLPGRVFGLPTPFSYGGAQGAMLAYEDGRIEIRDKNGNVLRSGSAQGAVTTPPLFVQAPRALVLVGTRNGLTALDAENLRALGRVTIKDDTPRGVLATADLDGDGAAEVVMLTQRGQVMAINAADGKTRWEKGGAIDAEASAFADLDADGGMDVIVAAGPSFAMALSGRDGTVIWKADEQSGLANHAPSPAGRTLISTSVGTSFLIVGTDSFGAGLRAIQLARSVTRLTNR